jgi:hypothetical protein
MSEDRPQPVNSKLFECLRFGSSIPGAYWGCCAADIMQCFKSDPDAPASIQMVDGDGGYPCVKNGEQLYAGPTNRDVFNARIRVGTFGIDDLPNHVFFAILTQEQLYGVYGKKWLAILKETGFEFIRSVSNSVYEGEELASYGELNEGGSVNHIFMLCRNIGEGGLSDPYTPPQIWRDLPFATNEAWAEIPKERCVELAKTNHKLQTEIWNKMGPAKFLTEAEVVAAGAPVIQAAYRTDRPQGVKKTTTTETKAPPKTAPWASPVSTGAQVM